MLFGHLADGGYNLFSQNIGQNSQGQRQMWFEEHVGNNEKRSYRILEVLCETRSKYQEIEILKLANQGICLVLDGKARVFEVDEYIYHEAITYPALARTSECKICLSNR